MLYYYDFFDSMVRFHLFDNRVPLVRKLCACCFKSFLLLFYKLGLKFVKESGDFDGIFVAAMKFKQRVVRTVVRRVWGLWRIIIGCVCRWLGCGRLRGRMRRGRRLWVWWKRRRIWVFKRRAFGGCLRAWQKFPNRRLLI